MPTKKTPARLHIILASKSEKAVIIRGYPSDKMSTILWDRKNNTFSSWESIKRIYERLSDISPGWEYFYYAWYNKNIQWEAISKTPSIKDMFWYSETYNWMKCCRKKLQILN